MSESTTLQHDVIVASEGRDAYLAMKSLLVSLGVYNVVEVQFLRLLSHGHVEKRLFVTTCFCIYARLGEVHCIV